MSGPCRRHRHASLRSSSYALVYARVTLFRRQVVQPGRSDCAEAAGAADVDQAPLPSSRHVGSSPVQQRAARTDDWHPWRLHDEVDLWNGALGVDNSDDDLWGKPKRSRKRRSRSGTPRSERMTAEKTRSQRGGSGKGRGRGRGKRRGTADTGSSDLPERRRDGDQTALNRELTGGQPAAADSDLPVGPDSVLNNTTPAGSNLESAAGPTNLVVQTTAARAARSDAQSAAARPGRQRGRGRGRRRGAAASVEWTRLAALQTTGCGAATRQCGQPTLPSSTSPAPRPAPVTNQTSASTTSTQANSPPSEVSPLPNVEADIPVSVPPHSAPTNVSLVPRYSIQGHVPPVPVYSSQGNLPRVPTYNGQGQGNVSQVPPYSVPANALPDPSFSVPASVPPSFSPRHPRTQSAALPPVSPHQPNFQRTNQSSVFNHRAQHSLPVSIYSQIAQEQLPHSVSLSYQAAQSARQPSVGAHIPQLITQSPYIPQLTCQSSVVPPAQGTQPPPPPPAGPPLSDPANDTCTRSPPAMSEAGLPNAAKVPSSVIVKGGFQVSPQSGQPVQSPPAVPATSLGQPAHLASMPGQPAVPSCSAGQPGAPPRPLEEGCVRRSPPPVMLPHLIPIGVVRPPAVAMVTPVAAQPASISPEAPRPASFGPKHSLHPSPPAAQRRAVLPQQPATQPQQPATQPQQPATQPQRPATQLQQPVTQLQQPATQPKRPATQPQRPATQLQQPATQPQRPATQLQQPVTQPQQPATQPQRPATQLQQPATQPQRPATQLQQPATQPQRPSPGRTEDVSAMCRQCGVSLADAAAAQHHAAVYHGRPLPCRFCSFWPTCTSDLERHLASVHGRNVPWTPLVQPSRTTPPPARAHAARPHLPPQRHPMQTAQQQQLAAKRPRLTPPAATDCGAGASAEDAKSPRPETVSTALAERGVTLTTTGSPGPRGGGGSVSSGRGGGNAARFAVPRAPAPFAAFHCRWCSRQFTTAAARTNHESSHVPPAQKSSPPPPQPQMKQQRPRQPSAARPGPQKAPGAPPASLPGSGAQLVVPVFDLSAANAARLDDLGVCGFLPVSKLGENRGQLGLPVVNVQGITKMGPSPRPVAFFHLGEAFPLR